LSASSSSDREEGQNSSRNQANGAATVRPIRLVFLFFGVVAFLWGFVNNVMVLQTLRPFKFSTTATAVAKASNWAPAREGKNGNITTSTTADSENAESVHVLFGLSGNHSGFMAEFEVALKSVLLNAPLDYDLAVHVVADREAYDALDGVLLNSRTEGADLSTWVMRNRVSIHTYNAQPYLRKWNAQLTQFLRKAMLAPSYGHTIGAFFRLFAHRILPKDIENVIYMDTDVVILSNLQNLWKIVNHDDENGPLFYIGESQCSGFIVINLKKTVKIWEAASKADLANISQHTHQAPDDQLVFRSIKMEYPDLVGVLPEEWDMNIADGLWMFKRAVVEKRPKVGMLHFNGGGSSKESFFVAHDFLKDKALKGTFGLVNYYVRLPWTWARFMAYSNVPENQAGFPLFVNHRSGANVTQSLR